MSTCNGNSSSPGTPTLSSGYTAQLTRHAIQCDRARILANLQCQPRPTPGPGAVYASVKEIEASVACGAPNGQVIQYKQVAVPESIRVQQLMRDAELCANNPLNPNTRFSQYARVFPSVVCVPTPMPTRPAPTFWRECTPNRFYPAK